ncbi:hypothetical protein JCM6882_003362 [Rhodosporidiobolus microsporus]
MRSFPVLSLLAGLSSLLLSPSTAAPAPLYPRQISNALALALPNDDAVYLTSDRYECDPVTVNITGFFPPFTLDAIRTPFNQGDNASQVVLQHVGDFGTGGSAAWNLTQTNLTVGEHFALRLGDGRGAVVFSEELEVRNGSSKADYCKNLHPSWWASIGVENQDIFLVFMIMGGVGFCSLVLVWYLACFRPRRARGAQAARRRAAAAAAAPAPTVAQPAVALQPVPVVLPAAAVEPVRRAAGIPLQRADTRPPGYEESMDKAVRGG